MEADFSVETDKANMRQITFPKTNSSYWIGTAGAKSFGRGDDITHLHLSEVAHYADQAVLTGVIEACVPGAWKVMETTANGIGEAFHKLWKESEDPASGSPWKRHFFSWFEDPTNKVLYGGESVRMNEAEKRMQKQFDLSNEQVLWYRAKRAGMPDKALMPQEYPCTAEEAFLSSGRHCFDVGKVAAKKRQALASPPLFTGYLEDDSQKIMAVSHSEGHLRAWKSPRPGRRYLIAADVAQGVAGGNFSVAQVFDRSSWEQVAVSRCRTDPGAWGRELVVLAKHYNNAVLAPENNSIGAATVEAIKAVSYPHLLKTSELWGDKEPVKEGFPTTDKHRNYCVTALRNAIDDDTVFFNDPVTLGEMETFIQNETTGKFEAQEGCEDDCVLSAGIGTYCLKFLTVDDTYREEARPFDKRALVGEPRPRGRAGY